MDARRSTPRRASADANDAGGATGDPQWKRQVGPKTRARRQAPTRASVLLVAALLASSLALVGPGASPASADHAAGITHDQAAFRAAIGGHTYTGFDTFDAGVEITNQIPGVTFSRPTDYTPLKTFASTSGTSSPNVLFGGFPPASDERRQTYIADFSPPVGAVGFHLAAQNPGTGPATVRYTFADGTTTQLSVSDNDGNESTPQYFGFQPTSGAITRLEVIAGSELSGVGSEEISLDDLAFASAGVDIPLTASRIAFARLDGGDQDVFVTDETGGSPINLTALSAGIDGDPHLSPDGRRIAFTSNRADQMDIWIMDVDGSNLRNLTGALTGANIYDGDPAWSPDGTRIAFASDRDGFDIYTVLVDAAAPSLVRISDASTFLGGGFPTWSPDGRTIAYRSDRSGNIDIWAAPADGSLAEVNLTQHPAEDQEPAWSPDGRSIVFTSNRTEAGDIGGDRDLWIMAANGGEQQRLLDNATDDGFPAWNPDGAQLVFDSGTGTTRDLFTLRLDDLVVEPLGAVGTAADGDGAASWWSSLRMSTVDSSVLPGATTIDPTTIPPTELPLSVADAVAGTPLKSVDMQSSPLKSVPLKSVPLKSVPLKSVPLKSVTLSDIPLKSVTGTWEQILAGTSLAGVPLQNVTLEQLLALDPAPAGLASIDLSDVDLSSTPLKSVSIVSLAMGSTPLKSVPLKSVDTGLDITWCAMLASLGYSCYALGLTEDSTILAVDLAGVPLKSVPLKSVPLKSVPLKSVDVESLPLKSVPLKSVRLDQIQLGGLLIADIPDIDRSTIVTCGTSCPATLGEAYLSNLIVEGATLGTLFDAIPLTAIHDDWDLLNLLQGLINIEDYPWESLPVEEIGVQDFAPAGAPIVAYDASFSVAGPGTGLRATATVQVPAGFRYVPGSSGMTDGSSLSEPAISGRSLTWSFEGLGDGVSRSWSFDLRPSLSLQAPAVAVLGVSIDGTASQALEQAPVTVYEDFEQSSITAERVRSGANDSIAGAVPISPNQLVISHIGTPGDLDFYKIPVPPKGTRLQVKLGNTGDDADLDVVLLNGAPVDPVTSTPLKSVPLKSVPLPDHGLEVSGVGDSLSSETLDDIPGVDLASTPLKSVSQNRSTADELIDTTSTAEALPGDVYYIQVSGFNGASSNTPYVLYVKQYDPPPPPECAGPRSFPFPGEGQAGTAPSIPATTKTLVLTSLERLGDTYGAADAANAVTKLGQLPDAVVYPIEAGAGVAAALAAWDADPCSPERANDVVDAVSGIVDDARAAAPGLTNIVIAGGDDIVPFARIADYTQLSNEGDYTSEVLSDGAGNPIAAAVATQNILSDDPYGDEDPIPWLDHYLYVPEQALGRLVETADDIAAQVDLFAASGGVLDPTTALTAGYDFLTDGSDAVDTALANRLPDSARSKLVSESWTRADLRDALFPAGGASPSIASPNAHYDHNRSLPALGNSTSDETDLFTVNDVRSQAPEALLKRILFTMGCHAGLAVPDSYFTAGDADSDDWAETYLGEQQKAAVYFANTGFGYGDTAAVALSERLMELFAERLNGSMTVGEAAVFAKHAYFGSMGAYGPYDEKAMQEATFYGLPMYRIGTTPTPVPASPTVTPDSSGVPSVDVTLQVAAFGTETSPAGGTYQTVTDGTFTIGGATRPASEGEAQVTQYRPIVPRTSQVVTSGDDQEAKGFLVTELASTDVPVIPAVARPVVDLSTNEAPPPLGDVAFPTSFSNISTYQGPGGEEQRLVLLPGQVFRNGGGGQGAVLRQFSTIGGEVTYGDPNGDQTAPFLTNVVSDIENGTLTLSADVRDASPIDRVVALVKDESGRWFLVELAGPNVGGTYTGSLAVTGTDVEYFVQALDTAGNVGITTNKGRYYLGVMPVQGAEAPVPATLTPATLNAGGNGWYTGDVTVTADGGAGTTYDVFLDGTYQTAFTGTGTGNDGTADFTMQVTGEGAHLIEVKGSDGTAAALFVPIDQTKPTVSIAGVEADTQYPANVIPRCVGSDALSGLAGCTIEVSGGDASHTEGRLTATATAVDRAGNTATTSVTYDVGLLFSGFLEPINDTGHTTSPTTSIFKAGSTVPVKFQLRDASGALVESATPPMWMTPEQGAKVEGSANESTETVQPTSGTTYTYDPETKTYQYNWKTTKSMAGSYWKVGVDLGNGRVYWTWIGLK